MLEKVKCVKIKKEQYVMKGNELEVRKWLSGTTERWKERKVMRRRRTCAVEKRWNDVSSSQQGQWSARRLVCLFVEGL